MNLAKRLAGAAIAAGFAAVALPALAAAPTSATYTINLPNYAVTDIHIFDNGSPFEVEIQGGASQLAAPQGVSTLTETFLTAAEVHVPGFVYTPGPIYMLGVTSNLPGDAPGQQHVVVFSNDTFAANAAGVDFDTIFPTTDEDTLINDLATDNTGDLNTFFNSYEAQGTSPNGAMTFNVGDSFTAIAFSDGQIIGTGTSALVAGVPEPASWALMIVGLGGMGAMLRTRRRSIPFAA